MVALFALVFFGILAGVAFFMAAGIYNGLVNLKKQVERLWANIDVILKQRFDEIPQLIQVIEQYTGHEKAILEKVTEARTRYVEASKIADKIKATNDMTHALNSVLAIGEAYPELKSSNHFLQLQNRLSALEEQIAERREQFNETVTSFNTRTEQFPDLFFAQALGYSQLDLYKIAEHENFLSSLEIKTAA